MKLARADKGPSALVTKSRSWSMGSLITNEFRKIGRAGLVGHPTLAEMPKVDPSQPLEPRRAENRPTNPALDLFVYLPYWDAPPTWYLDPALV